MRRGERRRGERRRGERRRGREEERRIGGKREKRRGREKREESQTSHRIGKNVELKVLNTVEAIGDKAGVAGEQASMA